MTHTGRAVAVGVIMLVGAAGPARAERFTGMKYRGGVPGATHKATGTVVLSGSELHFEDGKGRIVFTLPLATAQAWIGAEKKTTAGSILRSTALLMVTMPLSAYADPTTVCTRDTVPVLMLQVGADGQGATVRWRGPKEQLQAVADAINRAVRESAPPSPPPASQEDGDF